MRTTPAGITRRHVLRSLVGGSLLLPAILTELLADGQTAADPLAPRQPHFPPTARRVIFLLPSGGAAPMATFGSKPKLFQADGRMTGAGGGLSLEQRPLLRPRWPFRRGGRCGTLVSDIFPHLRDRMDDVCLINSMSTDN